MNECDDVRQQLSALLDGEIAEGTASIIHRHLDACSQCQSEWKSLGSLDHKLRDALVVCDVDDRVATIIRATQPVVDRGQNRLQRWFVAVAALAATLFVLVWANRTTSPSQAIHQSRSLNQPVIETVARLVKATGAVQILPPGTDQWSAVDQSSDTAIAKGSRLRTDLDVICELRTSKQGKVRLNESGEMVLHDAQKVELVSGQLWCLAPQTTSIDVDLPVKVNSAVPLAVMACPSSSEFQCVSTAGVRSCDSVSPTNPPGQLLIGTTTYSVDPGETVSIDDDQNVDRRSDPQLIDKVWQLPLLAIGTEADPELVDSITRLLAPIGRTKAMHLNEQQIRRLGPHGATALLAYVVTESSADQLALRRTAIHIAADLADHRSISLLQKLASDSDREISRRAQETLQRIAISENAATSPQGG
ncbi:anti-sigma factor [Stieleria sp. TO1_6]|uniref:zf-HC2 domain-containing protein n=1 Tax=Stieleria tagensis TaxID=2956795 RepID=UPI00209B14E2|nr:zf-HC2 domain-containing protein [Stieleria tagensis]MCO8121798.1 anti-sigma factor [Stieleria tagensis]